MHLGDEPPVRELCCEYPLGPDAHAPFDVDLEEPVAFAVEAEAVDVLLGLDVAGARMRWPELKLEGVEEFVVDPYRRWPVLRIRVHIQRDGAEHSFAELIYRQVAPGAEEQLLVAEESGELVGSAVTSPEGGALVNVVRRGVGLESSLEGGSVDADAAGLKVCPDVSVRFGRVPAEHLSESAARLLDAAHSDNANECLAGSDPVGRECTFSSPKLTELFT